MGTRGRKDGRGTKRAREEDESSKKPEMKLTIPEILKAKLVDDWEAVTKNNQVLCSFLSSCLSFSDYSFFWFVSYIATNSSSDT